MPSVSPTEWVAAVMSLLWVIAVGGYFLTGPVESGVLGYVLTLLAVFLPLALIWAAVTTLRSIRSLA